MYLIPRVVRHAQITKAKGTMIIPQWPSAPFWPWLFPDGTNPAIFISEWLELPSSETLFLPGRIGFNLFKGWPNIPVLAIRLEFNNQKNQMCMQVCMYIQKIYIKLIDPNVTDLI